MASRENDLQAIGRRVRAARRASGLSQIRLALAVKASLSTIVRLERGDGKRLDLQRLRKIARVVGVSVDALLTGARKGGTR